MKLATRAHVARRGFTLIELAIVVGILGLVFGSMSQVFEASRRTYGQGSSAAMVQNEARRALDRISSEFENAGFGTLLPNPLGLASDDLAFQVATGVNPADGTLLFGTSNRLRFVYEPGEANNGLDDDGDGLVDEGCIELTKNYLQAGQLTVTLARGVLELLEGETADGADDNGNGLIDERGFCMTRAGNLLWVRISMARPAAGTNPVVASVETALRLKN